MISRNQEETQRIAAGLVDKYKNFLKKGCLIFALEGELGTGKTVFAKGAAEALGIKKVIRSPSFIIQREFPYRLDNLSGDFIHIDLWRMESEAEVEKLKIGELIKPGNVILIEWAERMGTMLNKLDGLDDTIIVPIKINFFDKKRKLDIKRCSLRGIPLK